MHDLLVDDTELVGVLIREGYSPEEAVALIRETRGEDALCNYRFVRCLTNEANLGFWRAKAAA